MTSETDSEAPLVETPVVASPETPTVPVMAMDWGEFPWQPRAEARDWAYVVIHHTATESGSVDSIHRTHLARRDAAGNPWRGIGYHFVIGNGRGMEDGAIEPTFRWRQQLAGAHAGDNTYNQQGIGVCLVGNFQKRPPTSAQLASLKQLVGQLTQVYRIPPKNVVRHGDLKATDCPGKHLPMQEIVPTSQSASTPDQQVSRSDR